MSKTKGLIFTTEGVITIDTEDGGQAMIAEPLPINTLNSDDDNGMMVVIKSWDEDTEHGDMSKLVGRNVRVTIEILD